MMRVCLLLILIPMAWLLNSCTRCNPDKEVLLTVEFQGFTDMPEFEKVVGDGSAKAIPLKQITTNSDVFSSFELPVNSTTDSTRYFFYRPSRIDTLTIRYTRKFDLENNQCGFTVSFEEAYVSKNTLSSHAYVSIGYRCGGGLPGNCTFDSNLYIRP